MTRLAFCHRLGAFAFVAAILALEMTAHPSSPAPGTSDARVERFIAPNVVADPRSALTLDGEGVRFVGGDGLSDESRDETPTPVPLPSAAWLLVAGLAALIWKGWKR